VAVSIEDYRNLPGEHCGSTAMRNLLFHYCGLELTEAEVFGIGSGIDFMLLESASNDPAVFTFGRGPSLETDVAAAFGIDYRETPEPDDAIAWELVRAEVAAGNPTMLSGDAYYLDYRDFGVHFPSRTSAAVMIVNGRGCSPVASRQNVGCATSTAWCASSVSVMSTIASRCRSMNAASRRMSASAPATNRLPLGSQKSCCGSMTTR